MPVDVVGEKDMVNVHELNIAKKESSTFYQINKLVHPRTIEEVNRDVDFIDIFISHTCTGANIVHLLGLRTREKLPVNLANEIVKEIKQLMPRDPIRNELDRFTLLLRTLNMVYPERLKDIYPLEEDKKSDYEKLIARLHFSNLDTLDGFNYLLLGTAYREFWDKETENFKNTRKRQIENTLTGSDQMVGITLAAAYRVLFPTDHSMDERINYFKEEYLGRLANITNRIDLDEVLFCLKIICADKVKVEDNRLVLEFDTVTHQEKPLPERRKY